MNSNIDNPFDETCSFRKRVTTTDEYELIIDNDTATIIAAKMDTIFSACNSISGVHLTSPTTVIFEVDKKHADYALMCIRQTINELREGHK